MSNFFIVNSIIEWERRLELEEKRRGYYRIEPFVNYLSPVEPVRKERRNFLARFFGPKQVNEPVYTTRKEKPCADAQPC